MWRRAFRAYRFAFRWTFQVSLLLKIRLRYFTSEQVGIRILFIVICGHVTFFNVNVMWEDLDSLILIFHCFVQKCPLYPIRNFCRIFIGSHNCCVVSISTKLGVRSFWNVMGEYIVEKGAMSLP